METAYEALFIIDAGMPEDQASAVVNKYTGVLTGQGAQIDDIDRWEPRRLAYEIKGRREGLYIGINFRSEPAAKDELDRIFRISDDVLRHMVTKVDKKADRFPSKIRVAEMERRERAMAAAAAANPPAPAAAPQPVTELSASPAGGGVENADGVSDGHERVEPITAPAEGTLAEATPAETDADGE